MSTRRSNHRTNWIPSGSSVYSTNWINASLRSDSLSSNLADSDNSIKATWNGRSGNTAILHYDEMDWAVVNIAIMGLLRKKNIDIPAVFLNDFSRAAGETCAIYQKRQNVPGEGCIIKSFISACVTTSKQDISLRLTASRIFFFFVKFPALFHDRTSLPPLPFKREKKPERNN